jgi:hypothetical protein
MNQGTQGHRLVKKKNEGHKSCDAVPFNILNRQNLHHLMPSVRILPHK